MDRSEIMEIRKLFKAYKEESCPVHGFSGAFIDADGNVKGSFGTESFHDAEDAVKKRIFTFASKTISNNAVTIPAGNAKDLLEKINATSGSNKELMEELSSRIAGACKKAGQANTYAISLIAYSYDPPVKTSDHMVIHDGTTEETYAFIVCAISPVITSKPSYGYFSDKGRFGMNPLLKSVDNPICGFVYPDFTGRSADPDALLYFRTEKLDIAEWLFGGKAPELPPKEVKEKKGSPDTGEKNAKKIPSLDTGTLSMEEVHGRDIASERHENDDADEIKEIRKNDATEEPASPPAPASKLQKNRKVRISGDTGGVDRKMVDGIMCYVVPVSDAELG